ncbi:MAG: glycosyltransferase family 2 protein [Williamsia sp.]|nr:glycosyltransferase family 2 protein [Williamsia sp.]
MRPIAVPPYISVHNQPVDVLEKQAVFIKTKLQQFFSEEPEVSVVIPAYNEEQHILKTLASLAASATDKKFEVIVVNNNSQDRTAMLARLTGAVCLEEPVQGIAAARNRGLQQAKGRLILNADADTIYPPHWIGLMTAPLDDQKIALTYGSHAFLPTAGTGRLVYFGYELVAAVSRWLNSLREEAVNVYGFSSGFRRLEGIQVEGFDHPPGANEDGWLAVKLRHAFAKKLYRVSDVRALAWTNDRRIQADGGLVKGIIKRLKRHTKAFYP